MKDGGAWFVRPAPPVFLLVSRCVAVGAVAWGFAGLAGAGLRAGADGCVIHFGLLFAGSYLRHKG
jgi:hypothetical protein